jgi:polysaccharide deacetylase family protein (PEP-CTERM system associated)
VQKTILITIDVEDWFQVENFKPWIPFSTWDSRELRVEKNVHRLLDLFDFCEVSQKAQGIGHRAKGTTNNAEASIQQPEASIQQPEPSIQNPASIILDNNGPLTTDNGPTKKSPKATFFVLGWIAKRLPHLVREIYSRGHEVASHGYNHHLSSQLPPENLQKELRDTKSLLEDTIGSQVMGCRAPSFSINDAVLKITEDSGYLYDSSYNSFDLHRRYGRIDLSHNGKKGVAIEISSKFYELPISNLELKFPFSFELSARREPQGRMTLSSGRTSKKKLFSNNFVLPWGGGAYFRILPYPFFKKGIQSILNSENTYLFYLHPWEIDPKQPRVGKASAKYKFRHYTNLDKTYSKLVMLIEQFQYCQFVTCWQYIEQFLSEGKNAPNQF